MIERFGQMGIGKRIVVLLVVVVLGYNLVLGAIGTVVGGGDPGGPTSSSYATGDDGLGGFADLLVEQRHPVTRLTKPLAEADLDPRSTLVVADPGTLEAGDAEAVARFVAGGGRLLAVGESASPLVAALARQPLEWAPPGVERSAPLVPVDVTEGVGEVDGGGGSYTSTGAALPVVGGDDRVVVASLAAGGGGRVLAVADSSILQNSNLAAADNAALALNLAGPGRPVLFAETVHGYGRSEGLAALPSSWKWAAGGLAVALLAAMWSYGQRFGPPERRSRELAPARREYVDAVAADLARAAHDPEAMAPLRAAVRRRLAGRTGLPADDDGLRDAAVASGLVAADVDDALSRPPGTDQVVRAAAAATRLTGDDR